MVLNHVQSKISWLRDLKILAVALFRISNQLPCLGVIFKAGSAISSAFPETFRVSSTRSTLWKSKKHKWFTKRSQRVLPEIDSLQRHRGSK